MSKRFNAVQTTAGNVLAGYLRSKIDANALQPAIFSDLYGQKLKKVREGSFRIVDLTKALKDMKAAGRYKGRISGLKKADMLQKLRDVSYDFDLLDKVPKTYKQVLKAPVPKAKKRAAANGTVIIPPKPALKPSYAEVIQQPAPAVPSMRPSYASVLSGNVAPVAAKKRGRPRKNPM
jgi:hypothetical protein